MTRFEPTASACVWAALEWSVRSCPTMGGRTPVPQGAPRSQPAPKATASSFQHKLPETSGFPRERTVHMKVSISVWTRPRSHAGLWADVLITAVIVVIVTVMAWGGYVRVAVIALLVASRGLIARAIGRARAESRR